MVISNHLLTDVSGSRYCCFNTFNSKMGFFSKNPPPPKEKITKTPVIWRQQTKIECGFREASKVTFTRLHTGSRVIGWTIPNHMGNGWVTVKTNTTYVQLRYKLDPPPTQDASHCSTRIIELWTFTCHWFWLAVPYFFEGGKYVYNPEAPTKLLFAMLGKQIIPCCVRMIFC